MNPRAPPTLVCTSLRALCSCLIDITHEKNHVKWCTADFFISAYLDLVTRSTNSQTAEQRNAFLRKLETSLMYMKTSNALSLLNVTLAVLNSEQIAPR